jgi:hypothetical protein
MTLDLDTFLVAWYTIGTRSLTTGPKPGWSPSCRGASASARRCRTATDSPWLCGPSGGAVQCAHWSALPWSTGGPLSRACTAKGPTIGAAVGWRACWRQVVETVSAQLTDMLGLPCPRARRATGVLTRVAALNLGIWLNRLFGRPDLALATLFAASMANRHHPSEERDIARVISTPVSDHQHGPSGWEPTAVTVACGFYPTRPISGPCDGHAGEIVGMLVKTSRYAP